MRLRSPLVFWTALLAFMAGAIVWRVQWIYGAVERELGTQLAGSIASIGQALTGWRATRLGQAELVASIVADEPAVATRAFHALGARLAQREGYAEGWMVRGGAVESLAGGAPPAMYADPARDGIASAAVVARCGASAPAAAACIDFRAAIRDPADSTRVIGAVVLRLLARDSAFTMFRAPRAELPERVAVLAPLAGHEDSVVVLGSRGNTGPEVGGQVLALRELPAPLREAFAAARRDEVPGATGATAATAATRTGRGRGLASDDVYYAASPVDGSGWVVTRELDARGITKTMNIQLLIEETLIGSLLLALVALVRNRMRAGRRKRLEEITTLRADFVASASHELRTPLAQIRMFAELLRKGSLRTPEDADRALRIIEKEASRLTILVDNILNYARLRRRAEVRTGEGNGVHAVVDGDGTTPPVPADVALDVAQALEAFAPLAAERGVQVVSAVDGHPRAAIDSQALRQVLINFLENAVKYGPRGQTVTVGARAEGARVRLWVEDEGPGVPAGEHERIWTPFHRGRAAAESGQGGSGIGLSVVRDLVLHAGGTVSLESTAGGGARFIADLPASS